MPLTEEDLIQLARSRVLAQLQGGGARAHQEHQKQRQESAGGYDSISQGMSPEDLDYWVDITRRDLDELNPNTGKPAGWNKKVHRYTEPKGVPPPKAGKKQSGGR